MSENWRETLKELEVPTTAAAGPAGADGEWFQLAAAFGTRGFVRAMTDGTEFALECAPPGNVDAARSALLQGGWTVDEDQAPFIARRPFPEGVESFRPLWIAIAQITDAVRAEDESAFIDAARAGSGSTVGAETDNTSSSEIAAATAEGKEEPASSAFESIGASEADLRTMEQGAFAFQLEIRGDLVEVLLGFGSVVGPDEYERLERRLVGNLRGKYDVRVEIAGAHEVGVRLRHEAKSRVALRVSPDVGMGNLSPADVEAAVGAYLGTLAELAGSGIDPLVFLGVRASTRKSGAFESIGTGSVSPQLDRGSLTVDDEPGEDEDQNEVVFDARGTPDPKEPLHAGGYDDPRLKRTDATSTLVDVVLRHPGYSDRNMGQVLSILLSLDYSSCLEISGRAPTTIAWGVARDRGQTMKTVIEGAGGKVVLVEPGTFEED